MRILPKKLSDEEYIRKISKSRKKFRIVGVVSIILAPIGMLILLYIIRDLDGFILNLYEYFVEKHRGFLSPKAQRSWESVSFYIGLRTGFLISLVVFNVFMLFVTGIKCLVQNRAEKILIKKSQENGDRHIESLSS